MTVTVRLSFADALASDAVRELLVAKDRAHDWLEGRTAPGDGPETFRPKPTDDLIGLGRALGLEQSVLLEVIFQGCAARVRHLVEDLAGVEIVDANVMR